MFQNTNLQLVNKILLIFENVDTSLAMLVLILYIYLYQFCENKQKIQFSFNKKLFFFKPLRVRQATNEGKTASRRSFSLHNGNAANADNPIT